MTKFSTLLIKQPKFLLILLVFSFNTFANTQVTRINNDVSFYSEYYENPAAKFKGTIVFINGSGADISEWTSNKQFFNCISKIGPIFLYDRSALGKSPPNLQLSNKNPLTAALASEQLYLLLNNLKIKSPYILVAHSYGAIYAGYFTLKHPKLVKALFLIDPVPKDFNFSNKIIEKYNKGVKEAKLKPASYIYQKYNGSDAEVIYQLLGFKQSKIAIKKLGNISNNIPVFIISSTGMEAEHPIAEDWFNSQKQWLNKNPNSKIIQVTSGHFVQLEKPEIVCEELNKIIK